MFAASTITGSIGVASLRPTFLQSFFDRFHITLESYFTGSRAQDVTHKLSPDELVRHSAAVDHMYEDFKGRVMEGRGVGKEVIEGIAGGRVMTGMKAFGLTAPPELIRQIKGLDPIEGSQEGKGMEKTVEVTKEGTTVAVMKSPLEKNEGGVELAQDQETSPFAPVQEDSSNDSATGPVTPEAHARDALRTSTPEEQEPPKKPLVKKGGANNGVSGEFEYEMGPYGRGLVDGLGGLRDAAVYACQLFVSFLPSLRLSLCLRRLMSNCWMDSDRKRSCWIQGGEP